ncbi:hypothetical protein NC651_016303 [Populus alba x Populus x berolinensis]|nr:hypothetical protein NC651_016303 [Populus alba x Populus x berolinensis]
MLAHLWLEVQDRFRGDCSSNRLLIPFQKPSVSKHFHIIFSTLPPCGQGILVSRGCSIDCAFPVGRSLKASYLKELKRPNYWKEYCWTRKNIAKLVVKWTTSHYIALQHHKRRRPFVASVVETVAWIQMNPTDNGRSSMAASKGSEKTVSYFYWIYELDP